MSFAQYIEWAESVAYGILNLTPEQLGDLNCFELEKMIRGWETRRRLRTQEEAWFTVNIMRCLTDKANFEDLIAPFIPKEERKTDTETMKQRIRELKEEFGKEV